VLNEKNGHLKRHAYFEKKAILCVLYGSESVNHIYDFSIVPADWYLKKRNCGKTLLQDRYQSALKR